MNELFETRNIKAYLESHYGEMGGDVRITSFSANVVTAVIRNIRGEVISDRRYWEKLKIFAVRFKQDDKLHFNFILDGQYAAGLNAPADQSYIDMEPVYTANLLEYGDVLLLALREGVK